MYVKPAPGRVVVDPARLKGRREEAFLPAEGRHVADSDYWIRRLRDGDAIETDPPIPPVSDTPTDNPTGDADGALAKTEA